MSFFLGVVLAGLDSDTKKYPDWLVTNPKLLD
jgi:hypothetical protein